jgi:hypothetical protein
MNRLQYLLMKLAEESSEITQISLKTAQFGYDSSWNGSPTNIEHCHKELDDLMAAIEMLNEEFDFGYAFDREAIDAKKAKVNKFYQISVDLNKNNQGE